MVLTGKHISLFVSSVSPHKQNVTPPGQGITGSHPANGSSVGLIEENVGISVGEGDGANVDGANVDGGICEGETEGWKVGVVGSALGVPVEGLIVGSWLGGANEDSY